MDVLGYVMTGMALFLFGCLLLCCFSLTLTHDQAEEELVQYVVRRLRHREGD